MRQFKQMYRRDGWVLAECSNCKRLNYCEPHGTTARCSCSRSWPEHSPVPMEFRSFGGTEVIAVNGRLPKAANR